MKAIKKFLSFIIGFIIFFFIIQKKQRNRKYWVDPISEPQPHIALTVFLKSSQNLRLFKWLKRKRRLATNFIPIGSCIEKLKRFFTLKKFRSSVLNLPKDSVFLILLSNLFQSMIQYGENESLKPSVLDENVLSVSFCDDLVLSGKN